MSTDSYSHTTGTTSPYRTPGTTTYRQSATHGQTKTAAASHISAWPTGVSTDSYSQVRARPSGPSRARSAARATTTRASQAIRTGRTTTSTTIRTGILISVVRQPSPASYRAGAWCLP